MRAGVQDWPMVGRLLRRLDRHLPWRWRAHRTSPSPYPSDTPWAALAPSSSRPPAHL